MTDVLFILAGFALLTFAADRLVVAAARLAAKFGLSTVLIGAVVVGLGTSLPEMLVSGLAAARPGGLDFALGNIVGSNVANLALVLGVSALISPIARQPRTISREGGLMLVGSLLFAGLAYNNTLNRAEGLVLAFGLVGALALIVHWSRTGAVADLELEVSELTDPGDIDSRREALLAILSLSLTLLGADLLVRGARAVAETIGISDAVISLTLVAIGTSLPELATAVAAARRNENDLVLGNVLGSNIFNTLGVGGVAGIIGNSATQESFQRPLLTMIAVTVLTGVLALTTKSLGRREGLILLVSYPLILLSI
ncbi:MAG TPA: calcium/sodium antiporter [Acidimicrobiia bacterium]|jgi:cation:H+ antiporter